MWNPIQADEVLGLEQEGRLIRGALVRYRSRSVSIQKLFTLQLEQAGTQASGPLPLSKSLLDRILIVTGLSPEETLIRPLEVKLTKVADIDAVLAFQAEPLLPYPLEQAYIDRWIVGKTDDTTQISLVAARKELLQNHIHSFQESLHIDPECVSTFSAALASFANWYTSVKGLLLILHLGKENGMFLLVEEGKVLACQGLPLAMTALWHKDGASLDSNTLEAFRQTLMRMLFAFTKQAKGRDLSNLLYTGEGVQSAELCQKIQEWLGKSVIEITLRSPKDQLQSLLTYAIPIGLACSAFPDSRNSSPIQLRQGDDAYERPWKRVKNPLIAFTAASLLCALSLFLWNNTSLQTRHMQLHTQYRQLLAKMDRGQDAVEEEARKKAGLPALSDPCALADDLTPEEIDQRIALLEEDVQHTPDVFPLQPDIPRVSDLLAWLNSHPMATQINPKTGQKTPLFQIESLHYQMTKRPDRTKPKERYQVKVDLELQSNDSKGPRELYDALLQPNEVVDSNNPVTWAAGQGKYRITFFLKDHTIYP